MPPLSWRRLAIAAALAAVAWPLSAQPRQSKMLVIYGASAGVPAQRIAAAALREAFASAGERVALFEEFADYAWMADTAARVRGGVADRSNALRDYLARKYAGMKFDVVFTVGPEALNFYRKNRSVLFPTTPAVASIVFSD